MITMIKPPMSLTKRSVIPILIKPPHFFVFLRLVVFFLAGFFLVVLRLVDLRFLAGFLGTSNANGDLELDKSFCIQS